jgi:DNA-binding NarL/FixJ family response regulator
MDAPSTPQPTTVLVADAHLSARTGVRRALDGHGFDVVAEARDADECVELGLGTRPDVCLVEVTLPGGGVNAVRELNARLTETAVVMLTVSEGEDDFFDALRAGAAGYLLKETNPERLPHAIRGVLAGESAIPRKLLPRLMEEFRGSSRRRVALPKRRGPELTAREWEVLELLRGRLGTAEIARRLFVSEVTVRRHISAVLHKLGAPDREAALRLLDGDQRAA